MICRGKQQKVAENNTQVALLGSKIRQKVPNGIKTNKEYGLEYEPSWLTLVMEDISHKLEVLSFAYEELKLHLILLQDWNQQGVGPILTTKPKIAPHIGDSRLLKKQYISFLSYFDKLEHHNIIYKHACLD